jgi:hypothetical protein
MVAEEMGLQDITTQIRDVVRREHRLNTTSRSGNMMDTLHTRTPDFFDGGLNPCESAQLRRERELSDSGRISMVAFAAVKQLVADSNCGPYITGKERVACDALLEQLDTWKIYAGKGYVKECAARKTGFQDHYCRIEAGSLWLEDLRFLADGKLLTFWELEPLWQALLKYFVPTRYLTIQLEEASRKMQTPLRSMQLQAA